MEFDFNILHNMLTSCLHSQQIDFEIIYFQNGEDFLREFDIHKYDLLFFDILLGDGIDGMEIAHTVRDKGCKVPIIFTTGEREYAICGYDVRATDYLLKPYCQKDVQNALDTVLNTLRSRKFLAVSVGCEIRRICLEELVWAKMQNHILELYLENGELLQSYQTFKAFASRLPPLPQFQCCCRGVIVNLSYVTSLQGCDFLLKNGQKVPISRSKRSKMLQALSDYVLLNARKEMGL